MEYKMDLAFDVGIGLDALIGVIKHPIIHEIYLVKYTHFLEKFILRKVCQHSFVLPVELFGLEFELFISQVFINVF